MRKISVGEKLAGRHGNKVLFQRFCRGRYAVFADGKPVDIILNPLGVPSRMNMRQLLKLILGWAMEKTRV